MITTHRFSQWLRIARTKNLGNSTLLRLLKISNSPSKIIENFEQLIKQINPKKQISLCSEAEIEKEILETTKFGAKIITFEDDDYPKILKEISDPPLVITAKGNLELLQYHKVAIVGTREASLNALNFTRSIALTLGQNSTIVVSGMARGIDTAAHSASITSGTIAIIAGGINNIYPYENKKLYEQISSNGIVITEIPFGAPPRRENFVRRNRIISGLSSMVIIVEAGFGSGSLITANFALEQGREIFAVPGSPFDPRYHGTNSLIKDGANILTSIDDILEELPNAKLRFNESFISNKNVANEEKDSDFFDLADNDDIKKISDEILKMVSFSPVEIDDLISKINAPVNLFNIALMQLEIMDKVEINLKKVQNKLKI